MSRQLKTDDSSIEMIELTDSVIEEYKRVGLFLEPGQQITLGISYDKNADETWHAWTAPEVETFTFNAADDEEKGILRLIITATEDTSVNLLGNLMIYNKNWKDMIIDPLSIHYIPIIVHTFCSTH